ncbi:MAG: PAS domain S-box protein [Polyangiaceae bacterium]
MQGETPYFTWVNEPAARSLEHTREELTAGMGIMHIDPDFSPEGWQALVPVVREAGRFTIETLHRTRSGRVFPIEVTGNWFEHEGREYNLAVTRDITERKAAALALQSSEAAHRSLVENTPDFIVRWDRALDRVFVNTALASALGKSSGELVPGHFGASHSERQAAALARTKEAIERAFATGEGEVLELPFFGSDGEREVQVRIVPERDATGEVTTVLGIGRDITVLTQTMRELRASEQRFRQVTENADEAFWLIELETQRALYVSSAFQRVFNVSSSARFPALEEWLRACVHADDRARVRDTIRRAEAAHYDLEYRIVKPANQGGTRSIHERAYAIRDERGRPYRMAVVAEDVTVRRALEARLSQAQKMEAMGQLAGGIAHDFNNMLAVINLQGSFLLSRDLSDAGTREGIEQILTAADGAARLTRQLLTFSRGHVPQFVTLDARETVLGMMRLLRRVLGENVALETRFADDLPLLFADAGMIEQVLMNLSINARDAMPEGGHLTIGLAMELVEEEVARDHCVQSGKYVALTVTDTGAGIAPDVLPKIFDPFFTTKSPGRGTGLGLATVFGIVKQHHGWIDVESTVNRGTTFRVHLRASDATKPTTSRVGRAAELRRGAETILLVEDDNSLRGTARAVLERLGYRVFESDSASPACAIWEREHGAIDLLITDVVLPGGQSGRELARELRKQEGALPVLFITGYPNWERDELGQPDFVLPKPFDAAELSDAVARALGEDRESAG